MCQFAAYTARLALLTDFPVRKVSAGLEEKEAIVWCLFLALFSLLRNILSHKECESAEAASWSHGFDSSTAQERLGGSGCSVIVKLHINVSFSSVRKISFSHWHRMTDCCKPWLYTRAPHDGVVTYDPDRPGRNPQMFSFILGKRLYLLTLWGLQTLQHGDYLTWRY